MVNRAQLGNAYNAIKRAVNANYGSMESSRSIIDFAVIALQFLSEDCEQIDLQSLVPGKEYISFSRNSVVARPANQAYFNPNREVVASHWQCWASGEHLDGGQLARLLYTVAIAPCLAYDLFNRNDKKSQATYFERMVGHIFAKSLGIEPVKSAELPVSGRPVRMTMDFLFERPGNTPNIHLPVKMSTRERVVQAWAHQRLLESAYGAGSYTGTLVVFSETKLDVKKREVVEICVPDQWLAYQHLLAKMESIYYFDLPVRYQELTDEFPSAVTIRPFHEFFTETAYVAGQ